MTPTGEWRRMASSIRRSRASASTSRRRPSTTPAWPASTDIRRRVDRKSTRLNSSHVEISYAVFCSKKKTAPTASWPCLGSERQVQLRRHLGQGCGELCPDALECRLAFFIEAQHQHRGGVGGAAQAP